MADENKDGDDLFNFLNNLGDIAHKPKQEQPIDNESQTSKLEEAPQPLQNAFESWCKALKAAGGDIIYEPKYLFFSELNGSYLSRNYFYPLPQKEGGFVFRPKSRIEINTETGVVVNLLQEKTGKQEGGYIEWPDYMTGFNAVFEVSVPNNILSIELEYGNTEYLSGKDGGLMALRLTAFDKGLQVPDQHLFVSLDPFSFVGEAEEDKFRAIMENKPQEGYFWVVVNFEDVLWGKINSPSFQDVEDLRNRVTDPEIVSNMRSMTPEAFEKDLKWRRNLDLTELTGIKWYPTDSDSSEHQ